MNRKEHAETNSNIRLYKKRRSAIRMECRRVKITDEFANAVPTFAKVQRMQLAKNGP